MPQQFDYDGARKEGYSDDEIIAHLTKGRKFDVNGAVKEGYSKQEIIKHLIGTPVASARSNNPNHIPPGAPKGEVWGPAVARGAEIGVFEGLGVKPAATAGEVVKGTAEQVGEGIKDLVKGSWDQETKALPNWSPVGKAALLPFNVGANFIEQTVQSVENGFKNAAQAYKSGDYESAAEHVSSTLTQIATMKKAREAAEGGGPIEKVRSAVAPREVKLAGEKVPVLVGEAEPASKAGKLQTTLKRSGVAASKFEKFSTEQQAHVKQVIRNVAQQTSGMTGEMAEEPGTAMSNAADATFDKARPMYQALDQSLATVPDSMADVSKVTKTAIERAKKLGVEISQNEPESVVVSGQTYTPQNNPRAWELLKQQGMVPDATGQPVQSYMKVRSELLKMQRASSDAALRNAIGNEIAAMNANMEKALQGTPLLDSWHEANRLWSKGYAIRTVGDAIRKSTRGTPAAEQAPGLSKVPTTLKGAQLVRLLNELKQNGTLARAFTPEETANLRQAADILDRASAKAGSEFGPGYGWHSTLMRNVVKLPAYPVVKAMTTVEGVKALRSGNVAKFMAVVGVGTAANEERKTKKPGEQLRDLKKIQESHSSNPAMPAGEEQ